MTSMIQKVSIGVRTTTATINQYCVSESLSIEAHMKDTSTRYDGINRTAHLYSTLAVLLASSQASQTHPISSFSGY